MKLVMVALSSMVVVGLLGACSGDDDAVELSLPPNTPVDADAGGSSSSGQAGGSGSSGQADGSSSGGGSSSGQAGGGSSSSGGGTLPAPGTLNYECVALGNAGCDAGLRCECEDGAACTCQQGPRGTRSFGQGCTTVDECASALCISVAQAGSDRACTKLCDVDAECTDAKLSRCHPALGMCTHP